MLKKKLPVGQIALHCIFIVLVLAYLLPFLMIISVSLSDEQSVIRDGYSLIPKVFTTAAYEMVFSNPAQIIRSYIVTIFFSVTATVLAVLVMGLMAYPLARSEYRHRKFVTFYVLFTMLFSGGLVPTYLVITKYLHLKDNILVYILPGLVSAYNLIIIRTNYKSLPNELIEAAKLDGGSELYICFKIVIPLCKPVLASIGFLFFVNKWNDWNTAVLYIRDPDLYSLQYLLQRILRELQYLKTLASTGMLMGNEVFPAESFRYAMAVVAAGPVLCIFPFFQKFFTKGLTLGSVKG